MTRRIVVGLDGSAGARDALCWAVRLAARRGATVLTVTAWPDASRAGSRRRGRLRADRQALERMQARQIDAAAAGLAQPPPIGRELVFADAVTALCHRAATADLVVLGARRAGRRHPRPPCHGLSRRGVAARLAARLSARRERGRRVPPVIVASAAEVLVPPPPRVPVAA